jgi:cell division protein FtsX
VQFEELNKDTLYSFPFKVTFVGLGDALALLPGLVLVGAGLAAIAAATSIRRYLRV